MITRVADEVALASTGAGSAGSAGCGGRAADAQQEVVLRDGLRVVVRPLDAGDEAAIVSWFAGLGAETRYARFLAPLERLDRRTRSELARVDHFDHEAIAAVAPDGTTVGIARYIRIARRRSAEVAAAVADDWRGRGIASMLLDRVAARARAAGVEQLTAICLATNYTVIRLLSRLGPTTVGPSDAGLVDVRIDLMSTRPARSPSRAASDGRRD